MVLLVSALSSRSLLLNFGCFHSFAVPFVIRGIILINDYSLIVGSQLYVTVFNAFPW